MAMSLNNQQALGLVLGLVVVGVATLWATWEPAMPVPSAAHAPGVNGVNPCRVDRRRRNTRDCNTWRTNTAPTPPANGAVARCRHRPNSNRARAIRRPTCHPRRKPPRHPPPPRPRPRVPRRRTKPTD